MRSLTASGQDKLVLWWQQIPSELGEGPSIANVTDTAETSLALITDTQVEPLTRQEQNVLELIGQGLPNKLIARQLQISLNTLKVHIRNLYGKMGVENRTQALLKIREDDRSQ